MAMHQGDMIDGRYRLAQQIGQGGMGEVWRAQDTTLDRPVAIKILSDRRVSDEDKQSFFREARLAAAVRHRNVALVLDFGTREDGAPYIVMELLEGENLGDVFFRQGRLSFQEIVEIIEGTLSGLAAAHDVGIVHRDLKPENIFLSRDRDSLIPKLLDFGISKSLDAERPSPVVTQADRVVGTPAYMSPEQARGLKDIDHRSDLYSVGVILFEALSGEPPFFDDNPGDLMVQIITAPTPRLDKMVPGISKALSDFVERAMSRLPDARYQTADAMRADLEHLALHLVSEDDKRKLQARQLPPSWRETQAMAATGDQKRLASGQTRTMSMGAAAGRSAATPKASVLLLAAGLLVLAGGGALFWWSSQETPRPYVIKVQQPGESAALSASAANEPPPLPSPQQAPEPEAEAQAPVEAPREPARAPAATKPKRPRARRADRGPSTADTLSARFQSQKGSVVRCLQGAPADVTAQADMAIRFRVDRSGKVTQASVLPSGLASTQTGRCMQQAAQLMSFGPQSGDITFRIPLKARSAG